MPMNLNEHYPLVDIEGNRAFANNGNIILCYKLELPEIYSLSEKDFDELHGTWFQVLKSLPAGTVVHRQDIYRKQGYDAAGLPDRTFLERATHKHFKGREYMGHSAHLFFIWPRNKGLNQSRYVNPFKLVPRTLTGELSDTAKSFIQAVRDAVGFLANSPKLDCRPMNQMEILQLTDSYFNGYNEGFDTNILLERDKTQVGDHHFGVLALNNEACFGETVQSSRPNPALTTDDFSFHQGFVDGLGLALNEDHIINCILYLDDRHKWRKLLEKRIGELAKSSSFGSQNKVLHGKISRILDHINQDDSSRLVRGQLNLIYWCKEARRLEAIASRIKAELKEVDIVPYAPRGHQRTQYFLNSYWGFSPNFHDSDLFVMDLKHALCLQGNVTNYKSDEIGVIFNDRQHNIPVLKDVWDESKKRIKARNFAIFAPTGEGKSFLANNILRQYYEQGVRLVLIDLGGSYAKFAKLYPDDHSILRYEHGKNLGINPFYIPKADDVSPERLEDLMVFLFELMGGTSKPSKGEAVALKRILHSYYQKVPKDHSLGGFYGFVESDREELLERLGIDTTYFNVTNFLHILSEYVGDGLYSFLFEVDGDQSYRLEDKHLIVFELDEVRDNKEVLSVMLKLIKSAIQRTIWRNRSERGIILFDEFAKQLKFENVLESVEFYYQAIRKQNGAIGIILQSINQLPDNSTSASILENTQVIYSLRNEKGYGALAKRLNLTSHDLDQLRSIRNDLKGERKYTEIFIKIGSESNIFRLEVPPEVYAAYLTDGTESEAIMAIYNEVGSMETAIKEFLDPTNKSSIQNHRS
ncbi:TraG family conjugative transposon ATPase [Flagellimonas pacifica]|uniref:Bacteroides conjugation system ATPase, TraG family n=1 Tax=Flagellimonas pacifica TaxID=1247520 RepID=A0A285MQU0_9FLAO|nr:TraG family conjugative transposon ATPase [Allomuricauda parva]SNY99535.1 Bacteroides conjugation system ATPase, TraG family [Allomuricauda parva]